MPLERENSILSATNPKYCLFTLWWRSDYRYNCVCVLMWRSWEKQKQCKITNMPFGSPLPSCHQGSHILSRHYPLMVVGPCAFSCLLTLQSFKTHSSQCIIFLENPITFFCLIISKMLRRKQWSQRDTQRDITLKVKEHIWIINSNYSLIFRMCEVEGLRIFLCIFHFTHSALPLSFLNPSKKNELATLWLFWK